MQSREKSRLRSVHAGRKQLFPEIYIFAGQSEDFIGFPGAGLPQHCRGLYNSRITGNKNEGNAAILQRSTWKYTSSGRRPCCAPGNWYPLSGVPGAIFSQVRQRSPL